MNEIDPRYAAKWKEYRVYSSLGLLLVPLLGAAVIASVGFLVPLDFLRTIAVVGLGLAFIGLGTLIFSKVILFRCPRCNGFFFLNRKRPNFMIERCLCCGLPKGALNREDKYA